MKIKTARGFTLIELLITVSIIAILIAIGIASYATVNKKSRDTKRKSDIEQIRSALEMYRAQNGKYPAAGCAASTCPFVDVSALSTDLVSTYLSAIPSDPQKNAFYEYQPTGYSGGSYYGYCLSAELEAEIPTNTCTPDTNQNYGVKNP